MSLQRQMQDMERIVEISIALRGKLDELPRLLTDSSTSYYAEARCTQVQSEITALLRRLRRLLQSHSTSPNHQGWIVLRDLGYEAQGLLPGSARLPPLEFPSVAESHSTRPTTDRVSGVRRIADSPRMSRPPRLQSPISTPQEATLSTGSLTVQLFRQVRCTHRVDYEISSTGPQNGLRLASFDWTGESHTCTQRLRLHRNETGDRLVGVRVNVQLGLTFGLGVGRLDMLVYFEIAVAMQMDQISEEMGTELWRTWLGTGDERMTFGNDVEWRTY